MAKVLGGGWNVTVAIEEECALKKCVIPLIYLVGAIRNKRPIIIMPGGDAVK
jgi:hypothetical protein